MQLTKAVTHIRLTSMNAGKLAALDALAAEYMVLCQVYVTHFCTIAQPDEYAKYVYATPLSARWHRVAIQQAAGLAKSWRTKRRQAVIEYLSKLAWYNAQAPAKRETLRRPGWQEPRTPTLHSMSIQTNANVAVQAAAPVTLETAERTGADFWLTVSTLEQGKPIYRPVYLAEYHREQLAHQKVNTSVRLERRGNGAWWLTLSYDEVVQERTDLAGSIGNDIGCKNALTDSDGKHYGLFDAKLMRRHKADRQHRQNKAKLIACLKKKGVQKLPSTSNMRLSRHIRQTINHAVNHFFQDHPHQQLVMEALSISSMRFKAKALNAYLYAANLKHIIRQIEWGAAKRGLPIVYVNPAYSSQECHHCHFVSRANRPNQQTFCCKVCGTALNADVNAARNLLSRADDTALRRCTTLEQVKSLLLARHEQWQRHAQRGCP